MEPCHTSASSPSPVLKPLPFPGEALSLPTGCPEGLVEKGNIGKVREIEGLGQDGKKITAPRCFLGLPGSAQEERGRGGSLARREGRKAKGFREKPARRAWRRSRAGRRQRCKALI